ncbi:SPASM domain-containing protein [Acetatifactor muris]|uniref:SPASM domain-containing protein n=1 Tax=Acetatifactor muris TaxID=879566 RepID=UPI0023F3B601|nr:SPASM domain-containing protein [Acetatifactor muris]
MSEINRLLEEIEEIEKKASGIYIYGIGMYGRTAYKILSQNGIEIKGFVMTNPNKNELYTLPIINAEQAKKINAGIVLGLNIHNKNEVMEHLKNIHYDGDMVVDGTQAFLKESETRGGFDEKVPTIEVTTVIGCKVGCRFCPQKLLTGNYFKENPDRERIMTIDTYQKCLDHIPKKCNILFCGMAEPFLNPNCIDMLKMTVASGRKVDLYTTLVGLDKNRMEELLSVPVGWVTLHVADSMGYAKIPLTDDYYDMVKILLESKKKDGTPYINLCNAQTTPDSGILELCKGKYEILTDMNDRAEQLEDRRLVSSSRRQEKIACGYSGTTLNRNVLLPDGTLILCMQDYGMRHVIGNLLEESFEEIMRGEQIELVRKALMEPYSDVLCRSCSYAVVYGEAGEDELNDTGKNQ